MKIAVWHNLPSGGGKRALFDHVRGLLSAGHKVEAWCPTTADQTYLPLSTLVKEHVVPLGLERLDADRDFLCKFRRRVKALRASTAMARHCELCVSQMEAAGCDILFANTCLFFHAPRIGRHFRGPKLLYLQEPIRRLHEWWPRSPWPASLPEESWTARVSAPMKTRYFRQLAREEVLNARSYSRILCNSYFSRESIARAYGIDAHVCYLGVDTKLFRPLGLDRQRVVVSLGSLFRTKDAETAIRAIAQLSSPRPPFVWIGNFADDQYGPEMQRLAAKLEVDFRIQVLASDDEVVQLLNQATALLYTPRLEPFGYAPLEANACGTPVVAVAEGGVRETVIDSVTGLLRNRDPAELASALHMLLTSQDLARKLGKQGQERVRAEWNLQTSTRRLELHLRHVAAPSPENDQSSADVEATSSDSAGDRCSAVS